MRCHDRQESFAESVACDGVEKIDRPPLTEEVSADLVIIGGGFTGCSAALHAAEAGANVVLLEANLVGLARLAETPDMSMLVFGRPRTTSRRFLVKPQAPSSTRC